MPQNVNYSAAGGLSDALEEILSRKKAEQQQALLNQITTAKTVSDIQSQRDQAETNAMYRRAQAGLISEQELKLWGLTHEADSPLDPEGEKFLKSHHATGLIVPGHDETISSAIGGPTPVTKGPWAPGDPGMVTGDPEVPQESTTTSHVGSKFYGFPEQRQALAQQQAQKQLMGLSGGELNSLNPMQRALMLRNAFGKDPIPDNLLKEPGHIYTQDARGNVTQQPYQTDRDIFEGYKYPPGSGTPDQVYTIPDANSPTGYSSFWGNPMNHRTSPVVPPEGMSGPPKPPPNTPQEPIPPGQTPTTTPSNMPGNKPAASSGGDIKLDSKGPVDPRLRGVVPIAPQVFKGNPPANTANPNKISDAEIKNLAAARRDLEAGKPGAGPAFMTQAMGIANRGSTPAVKRAAQLMLDPKNQKNFGSSATTQAIVDFYANQGEPEFKSLTPQEKTEVVGLLSQIRAR